MDQVERLCSEAAIIDHGRLAASGTLAELRSTFGPGRTLEEIFLQITGRKQE